MFNKANAKTLGSKGGRQSGKRDFLTQQIIAELHEIDPTHNVNRARLLVRSLVDNAVGGDLAAQREVLDRVEGKPHQTTENYNHSEPSRMSDNDLAARVRDLLDRRLGVSSRVSDKANGTGKPH